MSFSEVVEIFHHVVPGVHENMQRFLSIQSFKYVPNLNLIARSVAMIFFRKVVTTVGITFLEK